MGIVRPRRKVTGVGHAACVHAHAKSQIQSPPLCEEDMDSVLHSMVVTGIFLAIAAAVGIRVGRSGKPYGFAKVALHIILFILVLSGVIASIYKLQLIADAGHYSKLFLYVTLLALLTNVAVGIRMIVVKTTNANLIATHKLSTFIMALSLIVSIIFAASGM
jgi:hypothetical protein